MKIWKIDITHHLVGDMQKPLAQWKSTWKIIHIYGVKTFFHWFFSNFWFLGPMGPSFNGGPHGPPVLMGAPRAPPPTSWGPWGIDRMDWNDGGITPYLYRIFLEFQKFGFLAYLMVPGVPGSLKIDSAWEKNRGTYLEIFSSILEKLIFENFRKIDVNTMLTI